VLDHYGSPLFRNDCCLDALKRMVNVVERIQLDAYQKAHMPLTTDEIRRIWLAEGRRRGYELVNA